MHRLNGLVGRCCLIFCYFRQGGVWELCHDASDIGSQVDVHIDYDVFFALFVS